MSQIFWVCWEGRKQALSKKKESISYTYTIYEIPEKFLLFPQTSKTSNISHYGLNPLDLAWNQRLQ